MSHHRPTRPADRHGFDAIIDARSPAEFAEDHIPGAINCPVLDDAERATVGTLYAQQGAFEARRVGGAMVAANLARHLRQQFADKPQGWRPLIYCWRGGMRSGSMVQWLRLVGWDAQQLAGGYKAFRRHVIEQIAALVPRLDLRVLVGATGSAKTRVLQALASQGAQVLDLEHCARHKGSLLGAMPGVEQPSQKNFETQIATALEGRFVVEDWHGFGPDYDRTLQAWRANIEAAWERLPPRYDARFRRMWQFYLAASMASFRVRRNQLWQLLLSPRGVPGGLPEVR